MFPVVSYLRAGILLHIITLLKFSLLALWGPKVLSSETGYKLELLIDAVILFFLVMLPVLTQLDARSRFQNYKRVKDQLKNFGFDRRLLTPLVKSRCQRDAALAAAKELGYDGHCREFYRALGYRWYHLTPDFLFSNPRFLFSRHFWKSTFFLSTYSAAKG